MSGTLRRSLLALFLAYTIVLTLCFSISKPVAEASADLTKIRKAFRAQSNPDRVQDIGNNCADFLDRFFDALGSKVYSHDLGTLLDRIKKTEISSKPFKQPFVSPDAVGLSGADGENRRIFIKPAPASDNKDYQQFRWNAIANTVVAELMHHARTAGLFSDANLDSAALKVMNAGEQAVALALMKSKSYEAGTIGHRFVKQHCKSTNPYGPPPTRN